MPFALPHNLYQEYLAGQKYARVDDVQQNFDACISASNTLDHSLSNTNAELSNTNAELSNTNAELSNTNAKVDTLAQSSVYLGKIELSAIPASMLPLNGWYAMNGDRYPLDSIVGQRLLEVMELDYMQEFLNNCPIYATEKILSENAIDRFPAMTSNIAPSPYSVGASIEHETYKAYMAFKKSSASSDGWLGFTTTTEPETASISFSFGSTKDWALVKYQLRSRNATPASYIPIGWYVYVGKSPDLNVDDWVLVDVKESNFTTYNQLLTFIPKYPYINKTGKVKFTFISDATNKVAMGEIILLTDTWTEQPVTEINIPDWSMIAPDYIGKGGTSLGGTVMPFMRPVNGERQVGSIERDAIRNIMGTTHRASGGAANSGAFTIAATGSYPYMATTGSTAPLLFSSDNVVPTGPENTVTNRGMTPVIYLGV